MSPPRHPLIVLATCLAAVALFAGILQWLWTTPAPAGASAAERLYYRECATCHGADGRGSWRAVLFLIRPGDLVAAARPGVHSDQYLFDIIEHGGAPVGRPGMPAFGATLSDEQIAMLVEYLRTLPRRDGDAASG